MRGVVQPGTSTVITGKPVNDPMQGKPNFKIMDLVEIGQHWGASLP